MMLFSVCLNIVILYSSFTTNFLSLQVYTSDRGKRTPLIRICSLHRRFVDNASSGVAMVC